MMHALGMPALFRPGASVSGKSRWAGSPSPCSDTHNESVFGERAFPFPGDNPRSADLAASPMGILSARFLSLAHHQHHAGLHCPCPLHRDRIFEISASRPGVSQTCMYSTAWLRDQPESGELESLARAGLVSMRRSRIWSSETTGTVFSSRLGRLYIRCRGFSSVCTRVPRAKLKNRFSRRYWALMWPLDSFLGDERRSRFPNHLVPGPGGKAR